MTDGPDDLQRCSRSIIFSYSMENCSSRDMEIPFDQCV